MYVMKEMAGERDKKQKWICKATEVFNVMDHGLTLITTFCLSSCFFHFKLNASLPIFPRSVFV